MIYDFDAVPDRRASDCGKWNFYAADILPMWVADMDFISPEPVIQALRRRVEHGIFGYPTSIGQAAFVPELTGAIVNWIAVRHGWQVPPEHIVLLPGVVPGFNLACHAFASPGGVLVQTPVYEPILRAAEHTGSRPHEMQLTYTADGTYSIDFDAFEAAMQPGVRLFILCNPHNPVGRVFRRDELERMAEICLRHGVLMVSDEIHADLVFSESRHVPLGSLDPEIARRTITLMAPSKTFNIAGLQCAYAIIPDETLRKQYLQANHGLLGWVNLMGATAAQAAYSDGQEWLDQVMAYLQANRDFMVDYVQRELPGIRVASPEGTYLAWLDCRSAEPAQAAEDPYHFFMEKARLGLNDGAGFGKDGKGFVRLNFGCPRSLLVEGLTRMKRALCE
jgi:cystathionine beta-lyase